MWLSAGELIETEREIKSEQAADECDQKVNGELGMGKEEKEARRRKGEKKEKNNGQDERR